MLNTADSATPFVAAAVSVTLLSAAALTAQPIKPAEESVAAVTEADVSAGVPLGEVGDPSHTLRAAIVQTSKGEKIGEVKAVEIGNDGRPKAVRVSTTGLLGLGTLTKSIKATDLIYVPHRNVLVSRLTKAEINALPSTPKKKTS